jgi:putative serine protease PepD
MSDDLFWPPLSGDGDESGGATDDSMPTESYPTVPLTANADSEADTPKSRRLVAAGVVAATAFAFGAGGVAVGAAVVNHNNGSSAGNGAAEVTTTVSPSALNTSPRSYAGIAAKVLPSVVSINVTSSSQDDTGSGVILRSDGYILTNNHVVSAASGGNGSVSVTFNDGSTASAHIVGTDPLDDLAVIKVAKTGLDAASLGNSSDVQVGDAVLAIGSPLGLTGTVTAGIVSALNRPVQTQEQTQPQQTNPFGLGQGGSSGSTQSALPTVFDAIQTDAAINPGNSGGALVDAAGDVIGLNSAIASLGSSSGSSQSGNIGVGFAIPINQARTISNELIATGHAVHPLLGVSLEDQTGSNGTARAVVHAVTAGSPAAQAGIKEGDVITAVDGTETEGVDAVIAAIRTHQPGEKVTVTIVRGGSTQTVTATLTTESATQG